MRLYTFTNFYLSSIQQGIQPAHAVSDLFVKYDDRKTTEYGLLSEWARDHKTMICLNGGNAAGLREIWAIVSTLGNRLRLPHVKFHEDHQSLDGTMTCIGIILPQFAYEAAAEIRSQGQASFAAANLPSGYIDLIQLINSCRLAQ